MEHYSKLLGLIGILIFIYLLLNIDLSLLLNSFKNIRLPFFLLSLLTIIPTIVLKAMKWLLVVDKEDRIPLKQGLFAWICGFGVGLITPGRLGDLIKAKFLKVRLGKSLLTVIIDRINDVSVLFILGILSVFILFSKQNSLLNLNYLFILFFTLFVVFILILKNQNITKKIGAPLYKYFVPEKFKKSVGENFNLFYRNLEKLDKKKIIGNFVLTLVAWFLCFVQYWLLSISLGLNLSYLSITLITPILLLVQLIPISISGIGTREATSVILLSPFGISPELAIAFSLGILIEDYILGCFGLFLWFKVKS